MKNYYKIAVDILIDHVLPLGEKRKEHFLQRAFINFFCSVPCDFPIALTEGERAALTDYLRLSKYYLEFGAGASTYLAVLYGGSVSITSVESDAGWINYLCKWRCIRKAQRKKRLLLSHAYIGETGLWGSPINDDKRDLFPNYSMLVWEKISKRPDLVLIDGRFRVACAAATALKCDKNCIILIHDYPIREEYFIVEEFLDKVEEIGTLTQFRIKDNCDFKRVKDIYEMYKYIEE